MTTQTAPNCSEQSETIKPGIDAHRASAFRCGRKEQEQGLTFWADYLDLAQAIAVMLEKHGIACDMLHGPDWESVVDDPKKKLLALPALQQHILEQDDGKKRCVQVVTELSRAFR
jgi:hypothetical protein